MLKSVICLLAAQISKKFTEGNSNYGQKTVENNLSLIQH